MSIYYHTESKQFFKPIEEEDPLYRQFKALVHRKMRDKYYPFTQGKLKVAIQVQKQLDLFVEEHKKLNP